MINEKLEVAEYLEGKSINKRCVYRICYMLAKHYKESGLDNIGIRSRIFEWGKKYNCYFEFNLNNLIYHALEDRDELRGETDVYISANDITEIRMRFDSKNTRILALALLAYGKVCANRHNECSVSLLGMSNWLNIDYANLVNRHFKELVDFGYIEKLQSPKRAWNKSSRNQMTRIRFNVPLLNEGEDRLSGNNIVEIFNKHF